MENRDRNFVYPAAFVVIALGFMLRLYTLDSESLWYDELLQLDIAQGPLTALGSLLPKHAAVPLDYIILHFWILLGRSEAWVRLPAVVLGTLTLPLAFQLGRSWLDDHTALLFMTLLALSPFHVRYSQETRPYALLVFGVMLAGYAFWRLRQSGRWRDLALLQLGVLIFSLAHFFAIVIFIPWLVFAIIETVTARQKRRPLWTGLGSLFVTGLGALLIILALGWGRTLWNVTWWGFGQALIETERFSLEASEKPNFGSGPQMSEKFFKTSIVGPLAGGNSDTALWVINGLVLLGLAYLLIQHRDKLSLLLVLWLILPVAVLLAFLVQRGAFFEPRYIIFVLPAYLMLLAVGILALPRWLTCAKPKAVSPGAFLLLSGFVLVTYITSLTSLYAKQEKEDWRVVGQLLAQNARPDDAVVAVNAEATLNWYYPPASASPDDFDTLAAVQAAVIEAERSWVVMSIFTTYIPDGKRVKAWLDEQGAVRLVVDPLIAVYYLGVTATPPQLLQEAQSFALPVDHVLYAELARQNRRKPAVARQYYQAALDYAPDETTRATYRAEIEALLGK